LRAVPRAKTIRRVRPASEERLREISWDALHGRAAALEGPLAEILAGTAAERVVDRVLRADRTLPGEARRALAEALFGVALWRRRLRAQLGDPGAAPRLLLAALLRDLAGRTDAEALADLAAGSLPLPRPPPAALADRASLPDWLADALVAVAGEAAGSLADALNLPGPLCLRVNLLRASRGEVAAQLAAEGVSTRPGRLAPACLVVTSPRPNVYGLAAHRAGVVEVQDEGSQLLGLLVGARPGESVLDACAGAGGKTLLLAADVGLEGRVHALDPDASRLERLRVRAERAGAAPMVVVHGATAPEGLEVDRALVDAPCSELGALRRGPDLRWRIDPAAFAGLPALQLEILARAARHVRPGGRLVYATCTFRQEEDEDVARAFEAGHPEYARGHPRADPSVVTAEGFVRTWPHRDGTDAFFAAIWDRIGA
jgi:16S rRNA (cytosine967-C5)-methyltransferase